MTHCSETRLSHTRYGTATPFAIFPLSGAHCTNSSLFSHLRSHTLERSLQAPSRRVLCIPARHRAVLAFSSPRPRQNSKALTLFSHHNLAEVAGPNLVARSRPRFTLSRSTSFLYRTRVSHFTHIHTQLPLSLLHACSWSRPYNELLSASFFFCLESCGRREELAESVNCIFGALA